MSTERLSAAAKKAAALSGRGVRRVFAIDVKRQRLLEWSRETDGWRLLRDGESLRDKTLALPLPMEALTRPGNIDDAMVRALLAKNNPVIVAAVEERRARRTAEGVSWVLLLVLAARGIRVTAAERRKVLECADDKQLAQWIQRAATATSAAVVFRR